jgi:hypothetical protein
MHLQINRDKLNSIIQPYVCGAVHVPRSHLGAVPLLVFAPCASSDKARYVNLQTITTMGRKSSVDRIEGLGPWKAAY